MGRQEQVKKRETVVPSKRTRGNWHKLTDRKFSKEFTVKVVKHWLTGTGFPNCGVSSHRYVQHPSKCCLEQPVLAWTLFLTRNLGGSLPASPAP